MSIRNEFKKIDPTEKQKKDIFRRIEESSKIKSDFRHQLIRYTSVAAASVVVVGTAAVGIHFATRGNGIDYTVSGNLSATVSTDDTSVIRVNDNKSDVSDVGSKADDSKADDSNAENPSSSNDSLSDSSNPESYVDSSVDNETEPEITTDDYGNVLINKALYNKIMNDELSDDEFANLVEYVYKGNCFMNEELNELVKARTEYNKTMQRTFKRFILSGGYENDDEWHITPATPGNSHNMKEWYDIACTLYADMPDYDIFLSRYSEYFKFDEQGNFYYTTDNPIECLVGKKMPFDAPSYNLFYVAPHCFAVNESTTGGAGLSIGVLWFDSIGTDGSTYRLEIAYFDITETSEGYRFIRNENS